MNFFRSEEHARNWSQFNPEMEEQLQPLAFYAERFAGEMFREFVKHCMQENRLIEGRLQIGGRRVDLKNITCPVLNLTAQHDHLVPCGQSLPFNDAVGSTDRRAITFPAGHIGMAVGSKAQRELWPTVCDWLSERSGA